MITINGRAGSVSGGRRRSEWLFRGFWIHHFMLDNVHYVNLEEKTAGKRIKHKPVERVAGTAGKQLTLWILALDSLK